MVEVFREVRRVLRPDGTLWLNMGDCYASSVNGNKHGDVGSRNGRKDDRAWRDKPLDTVRASGLKPKDLCGVPWRVAFALQDDGWYLRSDIVWSKVNPKPESVRDRPTLSHEYLFLLSRNERYYYDQEAIREPAIQRIETCARGPGLWDVEVMEVPGEPQHEGSNTNGISALSTRNRRSVWTIATQRGLGGHLGTFPEALVEPCILAGTSAKGCCPECGAPWQRDAHRAGEWHPTCRHAHAEPLPCTILDPFAGTGTSLAVAKRLNRYAIGVELKPAYVALLAQRCRREPARLPLFL